jgi:pyruvate-formate lyase-activating enzyme
MSGRRVAGSVLQVHATRHCNLRCAHCYSSSGPQLKGSLPLPILARLFDDAAAEGYDVASFSGGEPLMDPLIFAQIAAARRAGLTVNLVTNAMLITDAVAARLAQVAGVVGVSVDGPPESHDALRGRRGAFAHMERGLGRLRAAGVSFALIHTVRGDALKHLRWVAAFAQDAGAAALQLHVLEPSGRAAPDTSGADLATRLMLLAPGLVRDHPGLDVRIDVLPISHLPDWQGGRGVADRLAAVVDPLVLEPDGVLAPFTYGAPRRLAIGDITCRSLAEGLRPRRAQILSNALDHLADTRRRLMETHPWPFVSWHAELARAEPLAV